MIVDHVHRGYKWAKRVDGGRECDECHRLLKLQRTASDQRVIAGTVDRIVTDPQQIDWLRRTCHALKSKRGYSYSYIARELGVSRWGLEKILRRRQPPTGVRQSTFDGVRRIVAAGKRGHADPRNRFRTDMVEGDIARAAIRGLMLRGYTLGWIGKQIGSSQQHVSQILTRVSDRVSTKNDAALTALARQYGLTDGPSARTRALAIARGYESIVEHDEFL